MSGWSPGLCSAWIDSELDVLQWWLNNGKPLHVISSTIISILFCTILTHFQMYVSCFLLHYIQLVWWRTSVVHLTQFRCSVWLFIVFLLSTQFGGWSSVIVIDLFHVTVALHALVVCTSCTWSRTYMWRCLLSISSIKLVPGKVVPFVSQLSIFVTTKLSTRECTLYRQTTYITFIGFNWYPLSPE